ncbi:MAG: diguanylate cyclase [Ideonella sp.]|nr:diguanylate cyclase [Ideonella sp.]
MSLRLLPDGVSVQDVHAECLARMARRESTGLQSNVLGMLLVVLILGPSHPLWMVGGYVALRLSVLAYLQWLTRSVLRLSPTQATALGLDKRMLMGLSASGLTWGLLAWMLADIPHWGLQEQLMMMLLTVTSAMALIVTAHFGRGMVAFNVGLWTVAGARFLTEPLSASWPLLTSLLIYMVVLCLFGRQLHTQARDAVIGDLRNRHLASALEDSNAQLQAALEQAMALATKDPLTQALNRRAFLERAHLEAAAMQRDGSTASLLLLDLDHFKAVNDRHGHATGDVVLQQACASVKACLREVDVLARWGGEEFLLLLPRTELAGALQVAERIRNSLEQAEHPQWPAGLALTASIGIAPWPPALPVEQAINLADKALYRAKGMGRNRIDIWP